MANPRRTSARAASATPARNVSPTKRSTRGVSALPSESSTTKRTTRGALRQPGLSNGGITNPHLPEIQTQQSYAYGSTKTPLLPDQLVASEKMSIQQMAATLDAGVRRAEKHFDDHAAEAEANFNTPARADPRTERVRRRSASREGSVDSETQKTRRTAAWASSLDNSQLGDISEEDLPDDDDETRQGTDPSSFPSGIFDHSYNYERGRRGPNGARANKDNPIVRAFVAVWHFVSQCVADACHSLEWAILGIGDTVIHYTKALYYGVRSVPRILLNPRVGRFMRALIYGGIMIMLIGFSICTIYKSLLCNPYSDSPMQLLLHEYCGTCSVSSKLPRNITLEDRKDLLQLSKTLNLLTRRIEEAEARMNSQYGAKLSGISETLHDFDRQHQQLQSKIADIETRQPSSEIVRSMMHKINYFSPSAGAIVVPWRTSPTKQKSFTRLQRAYLSLFGLSKYKSKPPSAALEPWSDVGDCWCSSNTSKPVELTVTMGHLIFPTEVVIEHYPSSGSITPDTTPRVIEFWGDLCHHSPEQRKSMGIGQDSTERTMGLLGTATYDIHGPSHIQTFRLDVNQDVMKCHTQDITLRVISNYGADYTCMYRVRVFGIPVAPHSTPKVNATDREA